MCKKDVRIVEKEVYDKLKNNLNIKQQLELKSILKKPRENRILLIASKKVWPLYIYDEMKSVKYIKNVRSRNRFIKDKFKFYKEAPELKNIKKIKFKKVDIYRAIGVELTYNKCIVTSDFLFYGMFLKSVLNKLAHFDSKCLEIPSKILKTKKAILDNYQHITYITNSVGYYTHVEGVSGGGCHFNLDLTNEKFKYKFLKNIYADFYDRPYLNWIFNDDYDNITANKLPSWMKSHLNRGLYPRTKQYGLSYRNSRLEFRGFQMARNVEEFEKQLDFVNQYAEMAGKGLLKHIKDTPLNKFKNLLLQLGLNYKDYTIFIKRNYNQRKKYGVEYLV